jgi:hypothetical protein
MMMMMMMMLMMMMMMMMTLLDVPVSQSFGVIWFQKHPDITFVVQL